MQDKRVAKLLKLPKQVKTGYQATPSQILAYEPVSFETAIAMHEHCCATNTGSWQISTSARKIQDSGFDMARCFCASGVRWSCSINEVCSMNIWNS